MLLPYVIVVDVIATKDDVTSSIIASWQMLLPYDIVVDVEATWIACYNSYLVGVICQVEDGIATVGWMCVADVITKWQMEQPRLCLIWF